MPRYELEKIQGQRLKNMVEHVYKNVPFYRNKLNKAGIKPSDIKDLEDLYKLPFTSKADLRDNYPYGLFAVPMSDIVRIHASSGTSGYPTVVGYTKKDIADWTDMVARAISAAGGHQNSVMQVAYGYGLFTGGLGLHYGAELVGASVIPASGGNTKRQVQLLQDFGSSILACTPSYALYIAETLKDMGVDIKTLSLKAGIFGAEPWTESMRKEIEKRLNIKAYDIYGLSEIYGPGVGYECCAQNGMHICEDKIIAEVIDTDTLQPVPDGQYGELVFTTITKEGLPLLRYRTRDICKITREKCSCGRTMMRMGKTRGRSDDMLIIRGVNLFPTQIESALMEIGLVEPQYLIEVERVGILDELTVKVEISTENFSDEIRQLEEIRNTIFKSIQETTGLHANVQLIESKMLTRSEGKAIRVIDKRNLAA